MARKKAKSTQTPREASGSGSHRRFPERPAPEEHLTYLVGRTAYLFKKWVLRRLNTGGFPVPEEQMVILGRVYDTAGMTQSELSELTFKDKTTITRHMTAMVEKGLIEKQADPEDKRVQRIYITRQGEEIVEKLMPEVMHIIATVEASISKKDLEITKKTLRKIYDIAVENHS